MTLGQSFLEGMNLEGMKKGARAPIEHPVVSGIMGGFSVLALDTLTDTRVAAYQYIATPYTMYLLLSTMNNYLLNPLRRYNLLSSKRARPFSTKVYDLIIENSKILALAGAAAGASIQLGYLHSMENVSNVKEFEVLFAFSGALFGGITAEAVPVIIDNFRRLKKSKKTLNNILVKAYNKIWEHPWITGAAAGAYTLPKFLDVTKDTTFGRISTALMVVTVGALTTEITGMVGGVLHSDSIKVNRNRLARFYYRKIRGDLDKAIKYQRSIVDLSEGVEAIAKERVELGNLIIDQEKEVEGAIEYRKALRALSSKKRTRTIAEHFERKIGISRRFRRRRARYPGEKMILDVLNGDLPSLRQFEDMIEVDGDATDMYLYGKALTLLGKKEEGNKRRLSAIKETIEQEGMVPIIDTTRYKVALPKEAYFIGEVAVKELVEGEEVATRKVGERLFSLEGRTATEIIGGLELRGKEYLALEYEPGKRLFDVLWNREDIPNIQWKRIFEGASWIYTDDWLGVVSNEMRDPEKRIEEWMERLSIEQKRWIMQGVPILADNILTMNSVVQDDIQPKNILLPGEDVCFLDHAPRYNVKLTHEITDLIDYCPTLNTEKRFELAWEFYKIYSDIAGNRPRERTFPCAYLSSRILRTLDRYPYFINSKSLHKLLLMQLNDAAKTVDDLNWGCSHNFSIGNGLKLTTMKRGIEELAEGVRSLQA